MPEWLQTVLVSVLSVGFVGAVAKGYALIAARRQKSRTETAKTTHAQNRETRSDEIGVLQQSIEDFRNDRDALKRELSDQRDYFEKRISARDKEINTLKDHHTACLVELERQREREKHMEERIGHLETQIAGLTGKGT
jgi:DNA repair exonuclease SbcCD ATPase subunit